MISYQGRTQFCPRCSRKSGSPVRTEPVLRKLTVPSLHNLTELDQYSILSLCALQLQVLNKILRKAPMGELKDWLDAGNMESPSENDESEAENIQIISYFTLTQKLTIFMQTSSACGYSSHNKVPSTIASVMEKLIFLIQYSNLRSVMEKMDLYRTSFEANCSTDQTTLLITKYANFTKHDASSMKTLDKVRFYHPQAEAFMTASSNGDKVQPPSHTYARTGMFMRMRTSWLTCE